MATRTANAARNIFSGLGSQVLTLLLAFVNRTVFLRCLSVDYLGIQGLFSDILAMLSLADLGFGTAMAYSMYQPLATGDRQKLAGLTGLYKRVYRVIAATVILLGLILLPALRWLVRTDAEIPHLERYYLLSLANTAASYFVAYKTCILQADQKSYLITRNNMVFSAVSSIFGCIFLVLTRNYTVYLCIQVLVTYLRNFRISRLAERLYPYIGAEAALPKAETHAIFRSIRAVFLYKLSGVLINATDNTLISLLIGTEMVGYYSNYSMITAKLYGFLNTLFYSLTASLGNLVVREDEAKRFEIFQVMQTVSILLSTFCVVFLALLVQDFIRVWLGESYVLDGLTTAAVVFNFYFSIVLMPIWVFREATGLYRKTRYVMLATAAVNLIASVWLGRRWGLGGIVLATSLAKLCTYFWYEPKLLFRGYFGRSCRVYFVGVAKSLLVTAGVLSLCAGAVGWIPVYGWGMLLVKALSAALLCIALLWLIYGRSNGAALIFQRINAFFHRV